MHAYEVSQLERFYRYLPTRLAWAKVRNLLVLRVFSVPPLPDQLPGNEGQVRRTVTGIRS
jgi:hypothetical protein